MNFFRKFIPSSQPIISGDYQIISKPNLKVLKRKFANVWKSKTIPSLQQAITKKQIPDFSKVPAMKCLVTQLKALTKNGDKILEVGCSTGYHGEIFSRAGLKIKYTGCDYSPKFIQIAKKSYPQFQFDLDDATKLHYQSNSFSVVISGSCLLHIINYQEAIAQTARVSRKYIIFHRTPVIHLSPTTYTEKTGYNLKMLEILFNEDELLRLFAQNKFCVKEIATLSRFLVPGLKDPVYMKNYVCVKNF